MRDGLVLDAEIGGALVLPHDVGDDAAVATEVLLVDLVDDMDVRLRGVTARLNQPLGPIHFFMKPIQILNVTLRIDLKGKTF